MLSFSNFGSSQKQRSERLEESIEIARQLRIRDIGGLIVIDFIDLQEEKNRKKVFKILKDELYKDRAKVISSYNSTASR